MSIRDKTFTTDIGINHLEDCCAFYMNEEGDIEIVQQDDEDVILVMHYQIEELAAALNFIAVKSKQQKEFYEDVIRPEKEDEKHQHIPHH